MTIKLPFNDIMIPHPFDKQSHWIRDEKRIACIISAFPSVIMLTDVPQHFVPVGIALVCMGGELVVWSSYRVASLWDVV